MVLGAGCKGGGVGGCHHPFVCLSIVVLFLHFAGKWVGLHVMTQPADWL